MIGQRRLAALVVASALALGACSSGGGSDADKDPDRPATTGALDDTTTAPSDDQGDALPNDVPDETFPDLGDPRIDVVSYDVTVRSEVDDPSIEGEATLELQSTLDEPLPSFTLDLRGPEITEATVDGETAAVDAGDSDDEIVVTPAEPLEPGGVSTATFTYEGEPDQTLFPPLGMASGWQSDGNGGWFTMSQPNGTSTWIPSSDHPSDKATWRITLDTPKDMTGVASGRLEGGEPDVDGDRARWTWVQEEPTAPYLVLGAMGDYQLETRTLDGVAGVTSVLALPTDDADDLLDAFDDEAEMLAFFAERFGPYPDDDSGAIVVPTPLGVAFESHTRSLFGSNAVDGDSVWAFPHELAHQWFGNAVTPATWEDLWLNEGFATYADWLWRDHADVESLEDKAQEVSDGAGTGGLAVHDPLAAATFDLVIYEHGALALHALRLTVGDEVFFEILRRWVDENDGASVTTEDFVELASNEAGEDLSGFFEEWIERAPQPALPS